MAKRSMRRSRRRFRRGKHELIWVSIVSGSSPLDMSTTGAGGGNIASSFPAVTRSDWCRDPSQGGHLEKGCVLLRSIVSNFLFIDNSDTPPQTVVDCQGFCGERVVDEDDAAVLETVTPNYLDEDWAMLQPFFCRRILHNVATLTWVDYNHACQRVSWDSKVKRKLSSESQVELSAICYDSFAMNPPVLNWRCEARFLLLLP